MLPEAIMFDLDGTIVDTEEVHRRAYNQTFLDFGLGWDWKPEAYRDLLSVSGGSDRLIRYIDSLRAPAARRDQLCQLVPAIHREKTRLYGTLIAGHAAKVRPGVVRLIREAKAAGVKIGVAATSAPENNQTILASALGAETAGLIDAVVSATLVQRKKPAPDIYLLLVSMLGVRADRCVAIEDSANGVAAAKAVGLFTIATPTRWTETHDLAQADIVLSGLGEPDAAMPETGAASAGGSYVPIPQLQQMLASMREACA